MNSTLYCLCIDEFCITNIYLQGYVCFDRRRKRFAQSFNLTAGRTKHRRLRESSSLTEPFVTSGTTAFVCCCWFNLNAFKHVNRFQAIIYCTTVLAEIWDFALLIIAATALVFKSLHYLLCLLISSKNVADSFFFWFLLLLWSEHITWYIDKFVFFERAKRDNNNIAGRIWHYLSRKNCNLFIITLYLKHISSA